MWQAPRNADDIRSCAGNKLGQENITYCVHSAHALLKTFNSGNATLQNVILCWLLNWLNLPTRPRSGIREDPWPANLFMDFSIFSRVCEYAAGINFTGAFCFSTTLQYGKYLIRAYSISQLLGVPFLTTFASFQKRTKCYNIYICIYYITCYLHRYGKCTAI